MYGYFFWRNYCMVPVRHHFSPSGLPTLMRMYQRKCHLYTQVRNLIIIINTIIAKHNKSLTSNSRFFFCYSFHTFSSLTYYTRYVSIIQPKDILKRKTKMMTGLNGVLWLHTKVYFEFAKAKIIFFLSLFSIYYVEVGSGILNTLPYNR